MDSCMSDILDKEENLNIEKVKEELTRRINEEVEIKVYGMRGKTNDYKGKIHAIYPNIFTIIDNNTEKSFTYRDIITGDIKIKYRENTWNLLNFAIKYR